MMIFAWGLIEAFALTVIALSWAKRSKLDLALNSPLMSGAFWIMVAIGYEVCVRAAFHLFPDGTDALWLREIEQLSLAEDLFLFVLVGPVSEELLFRGAMFSALMRRWGMKTAVIVPSILWALLHTQYEWWVVASISITGITFAMIRWKSGSLYVPIALHSLFNLCDLAIYNLS